MAGDDLVLQILKAVQTDVSDIKKRLDAQSRTLDAQGRALDILQEDVRMIRAAVTTLPEPM